MAERASVPVVKAASIHHEQIPSARTERQILPPASPDKPEERQKANTAPVIPERKRAAPAVKESNFTIRRTTARKEWTKTVQRLPNKEGRNHEVKTPFLACSGVFVMMFSLLLLVVIVFSDEEDGGSGGNLIYGGVSVSQEVLTHKPMLEKVCKRIWHRGILKCAARHHSGGIRRHAGRRYAVLRISGASPNSLSTEESIKQGCKYFRNCSQRQKQRAVI